jgi:ketosteroid isomerase-like protein
MKYLLIHLVILLSLITGLPEALAGEEENKIEAEGGKWAVFYETDNLNGLMTLYTQDAVAKNKLTGAVYRDAGRSMLVYKKEHGQWKIAADIDQSSPDVTWPSPKGLK